LYRKYSRKDVFRILNVSENPVAQNVGGYLVSSDNKHCPIFVNYHKEDHISESTKYEDEFVNNKEFDWMSKSNRTLNSNDVQSILGQNGPIRLPLFIKKNNDEGMDFYYMGEVKPEQKLVVQTTLSNDKGKKLPVVKIRFNLADPVTSIMYNYLHEKSAVKTTKPQKTNKITSVKYSHVSNEELRNPTPLYDFYAAAGSFSDLQSEKNYSLIEGPENSLNKDYFACKIIGESMNRVIPNGSICLFKPYTGGSRNGKIVLVENRDIQDPDFNSAFTIKTYTSEKIITDNGWRHTSIVLRPNSLDSSYKDIIINEENAAEMRIVGEFVRVLNS
jgi:phage repressor protein C with HTH and peptisase S24 domain